jgi:hypothetical protein
MAICLWSLHIPHDVDCATELRKLMSELGEIAKTVRKVALEAVEAVVSCAAEAR